MPVSGFFDSKLSPLDPGSQNLELLHRSEGYTELWRCVREGQWRVLKCLREEYRNDLYLKEWLRKEYELGKDLQSPFIRRSYALIEHPQLGLCVELEYVEGSSLEDLLAAGQIPEQRRQLVDELCRALSYLHERQIIHRDLKPANILITKDGGHVKLIDLGFADSDRWAVLKEKAGTVGYVAPELMGGKADCRSDIYSLGIILTELGVGPKKVVRRCCSLNPHRRWSSVEQVREALERRRKFPWPAVIAAAVVIAPLLWWHNPVLNFISSLFPVKNNWTGLCFEAIEDGRLTFTLGPKTPVQYSYDAIHWITADSSGFSIPLKRRDLVYVRGKRYGYSSGSLEKRKYSHFKTQGLCYVYGNIMSLIDSTCFEGLTTLTRSHNFARLFEENPNLRFHPKKKLLLPATTLAVGCYRWMFRGCTGLTEAPELPATELKGYCYQSMFEGCTALRTSPALPAKAVPPFGYHRMFSGCTALTDAPELPALRISEGAYQELFDDCTSLVKAPALPATSLSKECYKQMFEGCTSLTEAPDLPATELEESCYSFMFSSSGLQKAPELPAIVLSPSCYAFMFAYCNALTQTPVLPAETLTEHCYLGMFQYCNHISLIDVRARDISAPDCTTHWLLETPPGGIFCCPPDTPWSTKSPNGIPKGWEVKVAVDK